MAKKKDKPSEAPPEKNPAAVELGRKGGEATAKQHGPEYYRKLQAKRKHRRGGRPRKSSQSEFPK